MFHPFQVYVGQRPKKKKRLEQQHVDIAETSYSEFEEEEPPYTTCDGQVAVNDLVVLDPAEYPNEFPVIAKVSSCHSYIIVF